MSWQEYIDDHLLAELPHGGTLEHAAIASLEGDIWAQSPNFPELSEAEAQAINTGFDDQVSLASKGLFVGGKKFIVVTGEEGAVIRGKAGQEGRGTPETDVMSFSECHAQSSSPLPHGPVFAVTHRLVCNGMH